MDRRESPARTEERPAGIKDIAGREFRRERRNVARAVKISVIIPAHNEAAYLPQTLAALRDRVYPAVEIIVVTNGCTDQTAEVARGACDRLVVLSQKNLGVARNLGARIATGDLLVFVDADTILEPGALRVIAEKFRQGDAAGTVKGLPANRRLVYRLIYWLKNLTHRSRLHAGSSGVILCWKEHFVRLGGFDEDLEMRENSDLIRRLQRFGRYRYIGETTATTSMRRYERCGAARTIWLWVRVWFESLFGDLHRRRYEIIR